MANLPGDCAVDCSILTNFGLVELFAQLVSKDNKTLHRNVNFTFGVKNKI
jgi:hypothetical protein